MQVQAAEELPPGLKERIEREFELHRHAFSRELVEHCCPRTVSVRRGDNRERIQEFVDQQVAAAYQDQSLNFQIETDDGVYVVNPQGCSVVCAEEQGRGESEGQRENVSSVSTDDLLGQHEFQSIMARVMSDIKRIQGREQTPSEPRVPELAVRMGDFSRRTPIESYLGGVISYVLYTHHIDSQKLSGTHIAQPSMLHADPCIATLAEMLNSRAICYDSVVEAFYLEQGAYQIILVSTLAFGLGEEKELSCKVLPCEDYSGPSHLTLPEAALTFDPCVRQSLISSNTLRENDTLIFVEYKRAFRVGNECSILIASNPVRVGDRHAPWVRCDLFDIWGRHAGGTDWDRNRHLMLAPVMVESCNESEMALTMLTPLENDETGYFTNPVMLFAVREKDDADQTQVLQPAELQQVL